MIIAQAARGLSAAPASAARFLPGGFPPPPPMAPTAETRLSMETLADTLQALATEGPDTFYGGALGRRIAAEIQGLGGSLSVQDLAAYDAKRLEPLRIGYRDATIWATPELSAGPTLADVLRRHVALTPGTVPDAPWYLSIAAALTEAYKTRLAEMGDVEGGRRTGCTSHFSVTDKDGMCVSVTQTLLSVFGSMVTLPETGILMNNGVFWFDPRPGNPNSLAPSKRCLSNMCPIVMETGTGQVFALGASGGRRILPAVAQVATLLADFGMDLEEALHAPRIDVSGAGVVLAESALPGPTQAALAAAFTVAAKKRSVYPSWFANISATAHCGALRLGGSEPTLPWSDAVASEA